MIKKIMTKHLEGGSEKLNIYAINFNTQTYKIEADIYEIQYNNLDEQYNQLLELLNADGLDVLDYNERIAILVDDRGFEKPYNPVFEVKTEDKITTALAGKLLFVRNIYNEESTDFGSITSEDITYLINTLQISVKGLVKNPL